MIGAREGPARRDDHVRGQRAPDQRDPGGDRAEGELHTIALGRVDAMLALRRWLEDGGLAGLLADRTLPVPIAALEGRRPALPRRSRRAFPTGRFASPRCCAARVVFMAGLYRGGDATNCASSSSPTSPPSAAPAAAAERDARDPCGAAALCRDARGAVPRGAVQLVQLLRLLGRRRTDGARAQRRERRRSSPRPQRARPARERRARAARGACRRAST